MHKSKTQSSKPSFSSTLLDEIYNSIDVKTQKSQSFLGSVNYTTKKQNIVTRSVLDRKIHQDRFLSSVSSSSDSNSSIFSSSDTELTHGKKISSSKPRKPQEKVYATRHEENREIPRIRRSKEPKTPASPAGRVVNFINSLFNNNSKQSTATCSSASSFSRSCMNKSSQKSSDRIKPNVRFSQPHKSFTNRSEDYISNRKSVKKSVVEDKGRRSAKDILRNSLVKKNGFEDYEDDVISNSSSDLFELDLLRNHHTVYENELPLYETTFAGLIL